MIRNYIKIAIRSIFKHKFYSLLNIIGLSVGMAKAALANPVKSLRSE